jgi:hypothetical protein
MVSEGWEDGYYRELKSLTRNQCPSCKEDNYRDALQNGFTPEKVVSTLETISLQVQLKELNHDLNFLTEKLKMETARADKATEEASAWGEANFKLKAEIDKLKIELDKIYSRFEILDL